MQQKSFTRKAEGDHGESIATQFLKKHEYSIITRNYKIRNGEIDIIAIDKKENTLVFVEVKTRSSDKFGTPLESIHYWKLKALMNAAHVYKNSHKGLPDQLRIDAVSIYLSSSGGLQSIEHIKNISM